MKSRNLLMKPIKAIPMIMALGIAVSACAQPVKVGGDSWKEEVLLHDGQKIVVERSQSYGGRTEPGQAGAVIEHIINFSMPGSSKAITWASEYGADIGRADFNLLAVHVLNGKPYVVASPNLCLSYNKWGRPNPAYVLFRYEGNAWQRIPLEALPTEFKTVNVVLSTQKVEAGQLSNMGLISAEKVKELNRDVRLSELKSIRREVLQKGTGDAVGSSVNCQEVVYYKGAWVGPGDSIGKRMMDSKSK